MMIGYKESNGVFTDVTNLLPQERPIRGLLANGIGASYPNSLVANGIPQNKWVNLPGVMDGVGHSHRTLSELESLDLTTTFRLKGWVPVSTWDTYQFTQDKRDLYPYRNSPKDESWISFCFEDVTLAEVAEDDLNQILGILGNDDTLYYWFE